MHLCFTLRVHFVNLLSTTRIDLFITRKLISRAMRQNRLHRVWWCNWADCCKTLRMLAADGGVSEIDGLFDFRIRRGPARVPRAGCI